MIALSKFKEIDKLKSIEEKQRAWMEDYNGMVYSIAKDETHLMNWATEKRNYFDYVFSPDINLIGEIGNRLKIEFDGNEKRAKECLEITQNLLKEKGVGFIRSTHKGKSDYLWVEFTRNLTDEEKKKFLCWIAPENSEVDMNFFSSKKVFQILYATHWRHSKERELPIEFFEGEQIDYDKLKIKVSKVKLKRKVNKSFEYVTGIKEAAKVFTLESQAEKFNEIQPIFYDKAGMFWLWNDKIKCWEISDDVDILNMIHETTGKDVITSSKRTEILNALKQKGRLNTPKPIKKTWIQFKETIVDFETGEEFEATPEYFVTNPIPWELNKERFIETPMIDKIFSEWVGEDHKQILYEILAYSLIPDYPIHRLFCFIGEGMNGKSCFLRLLQKFVGENNVTATELDTLLNSRFEVTRLHKKLVCVMGETNFAEMSKTSIIKKLTGQDIIGFEYKNKTPFEGENYAKIVIATNNLPTTTDKTIGFYRRWCIIDFPNRFSEKKDILSQIPDEEYEILCVKSLIILKDLLEKREFSKEGSIEERAKKYEDKSDPLQKFLEEFTDLDDPNGSIFKWEFEKTLNEWLKENRHRSMSDIIINKKLKQKGMEDGRIFSTFYENGVENKKQIRAWVGIKWKSLRE